MGSKMMPWTLENFAWDKTKLENSWKRIMLVDLNNQADFYKRFQQQQAVRV